MPVTVPRGPTTDQDEGVRAVVAALGAYQARHPGSVAEAYRHGRYIIRIRVLDPEFQGLTKVERHRLVWPVLEELAEEVVSDISTLILITPEERATSFSSLEFDDPMPSRF